MKIFRVSFDTCEYQEKICLVVADSAERAIEIVKSENSAYFSISCFENRGRDIYVNEISLEEEGIKDTFFF